MRPYEWGFKGQESVSPASENRCKKTPNSLESGVLQKTR